MTVSFPGKSWLRTRHLRPDTGWLAVGRPGRHRRPPGPGHPARRYPGVDTALLQDGTAALAAGPVGGFQAMAVSGGKLTVYQLTAVGAWSRTQAVSVPIQYGSSS